MTDFKNMQEIDIKTISLKDYFDRLDNKKLLQINFLDSCIELQFDKGYLRVMAKSVIKMTEGNFELPSKEGNWRLYSLLNCEIISVEEGKETILIKSDNGSEILVDLSAPLSGDCFHMQVMNLPTIHI